MGEAKRLGLAGLCATAVTFGPARNGFGLFLPYFRDDFALSTTTLGFIASGLYVGYLLALSAVGLLASRIGPRLPVVIGVVSAGLGMGLVALAPNSLVLAAGVVLAGSGAGWTWAPFNDATAHIAAPSGSRALRRQYRHDGGHSCRWCDRSGDGRQLAGGMDGVRGRRRRCRHPQHPRPSRRDGCGRAPTRGMDVAAADRGGAAGGGGRLVRCDQCVLLLVRGGCGHRGRRAATGDRRWDPVRRDRRGRVGRAVHRDGRRPSGVGARPDDHLGLAGRRVTVDRCRAGTSSVRDRVRGALRGRCHGHERHAVHMELVGVRRTPTAGFSATLFVLGLGLVAGPAALGALGGVHGLATSFLVAAALTLTTMIPQPLLGGRPKAS